MNAEKPKFYTRTSPTARWHMSKDAISLSTDKLATMTDAEAREFMIAVRWGDASTMVCPHCGTIGGHSFRGADKRWNCPGCRKTFSVTSGTVYSNRKLPLQLLLSGLLAFINGASGVPALQIRRNSGRAYNTWFALLHKLREGFEYGHNTGLISGDIEMDGAWRLGRESRKKRGRPQGKKSTKTLADAVSEVNAKSMTGVAQQKERNAQKDRHTGMRSAEFRAPLVEGRRSVLNGRLRSNVRGKGAALTRVAIDKDETPAAIHAMLSQYVAMPESILNTDGMTAYNSAGAKFREHHQVDHSTHFSGPNGENNNQSEEFNKRLKRLECGVYLNAGVKYLQEYAAEAAYRSDARRLSNGDQFKLAMHLATTIGPSRHWIGYTHGQHRDYEVLATGNLETKARGPRKGRDPMQIRNGPPR